MFGNVIEQGFSSSHQKIWQTDNHR